jgi:hypothetical protein
MYADRAGGRVPHAARAALSAGAGCQNAARGEFPGTTWNFEDATCTVSAPAATVWAVNVGPLRLQPAEPYHAIAMKLRLTAAVLACTSRKELCVRFRAVNRATHCDLDRLHKWMQGRALPRAPGLYDDWAKVLGLTRSGAWLAACPIEEFRAALVGPDGVPADLPPDVGPRRRSAGGGPGVLGGARMLCGDYACYSHAWSPRHGGALIRGSLAIRPGKGTRLVATYGERLLNGSMRISGEVTVTGRSIHFLVWEPDGNLPIFFSLIMPGPPAGALCGMMSGVAFVAHVALPSASRVLMVRLPGAAALEASNGYLDPSPGFLTEDLARLDLRPGRGEELDALATRYFASSADQVTPADQEAFIELLDPGHAAAPAAMQDLRRAAGRLRLAEGN